MSCTSCGPTSAGHAGSSSVEEILAQFQAGKDANFSLLSYVSDVHAEVEKLEAQIATLTAEVRKYKGSGTSAADTRRAGLQVGPHLVSIFLPWFFNMFFTKEEVGVAYNQRTCNFHRMRPTVCPTQPRFSTSASVPLGVRSGCLLKGCPAVCQPHAAPGQLCQPGCCGLGGCLCPARPPLCAEPAYHPAGLSTDASRAPLRRRLL